MANGVTTEWEDIHVKLGNYVARDKEPENNELEKIIIEKLEAYDPLENKTMQELKEIDDDEDEEVLKIYKEKRMKEMQEYALKPKYGKLLEIRKQDYIQEVTNAPKDVFVVLHLYQTYVEASNVMTKILENLARKFPLVKFINIQATNCCEGFKDADVPALLIYQNAQMVRQFVPATYYFGGKNLSWKKVEWILSSLGVVKSDLIDDPFETEEIYSVSDKKKKPKRDDESDEEDRDDREYSWKIVRK